MQSISSGKFDKLIEKVSSKAAEFNKIPYPILLNYWKKRISTTLQFGNVAPTIACETLQRDFDLECAFD